jgi:hypothetical protein
MTSPGPIHVLVLEEFRLLVSENGALAARIVAASPPGEELPIPLLTSIDDRRDVATLRALREREAENDSALRAALDGLVASWSAPKRYAPRIAERSQSPPSVFRLAVTESGINGAGVPAVTVIERPTRSAGARAIGLLWVGAPIDTHAGLLILLGSYADARDARSAWPLPFSRQLGVRIYESSAT